MADDWVNDPDNVAEDAVEIEMNGGYFVGVLSIDTGGSFPTRHKKFSAIEHGHAHAVADAIEYLAKEVLPEAIERDHRLQSEGASPSKGFDRPVEEGDG